MDNLYEKYIFMLVFIFFCCMKLLKDSLRKTLAHRHMGHQMVGAVALNAVNTFLHNLKFKIWNLEFKNIEGYVRFNVMFLKTNDQALKIKIFQQKNQILREVNLAIEKVGYATRVVDIRMK